jgi:uncharacterized protein (TIGR02246 family)
MKRTIALFVLLFTAASSLLHAETGVLSPEETEAIVTKFQAAYADTFNRRDAAGMSALLTENATLQNEWGGVTQGRTNIQALVTRLMAGLAQGTTLEDTSLASQAVAKDVIVSQGTSRRLTPDQPPVEMFFTRVLVLQDGAWKLAATQIARPSSMPKPGSK